jgi:hypothetical protein
MQHSLSTMCIFISVLKHLSSSHCKEVILCVCLTVASFCGFEGEIVLSATYFISLKYSRSLWASQAQSTKNLVTLAPSVLDFPISWISSIGLPLKRKFGLNWNNCGKQRRLFRFRDFRLTQLYFNSFLLFYSNYIHIYNLNIYIYIYI